jgi:hypothetical protein
MVNGEKRAIQATWRHLLIANSSWKCNRRLSTASPQRGEMFIAWRVISLFQKLRRSAIAFACPGEGSAAGFAPNGARSLAERT